MKTYFTMLMVAVIAPAFAQSNATEPVKTGSQSCEDLVFNTRELTQFAYNTRCKTEAYPFLSEDGNDLYFTNNQSYDWVFYTHKDSVNNVWSVPVPVKLANHTTAIRSSYLSADYKTMYFVGSGFYRAEAISESRIEFSQPERIEIINTSHYKDADVQPFSCLSFADNMQQMYAYTGVDARDEGFNTMGLYNKTGDNTYQFVRFISTTTKEIGTLSGDGLTYFFTNDDSKNILFCRKRTTVKEEFGEEVFVVKEFEAHLDLTQLRVSGLANSMVMVLSEGLWDKNDIFFYNYSNTDLAYALYDKRNEASAVVVSEEILPVLVSEKDAPQPLRNVEIVGQTGSKLAKIEIGNPFPNPAKQLFYIYYNVSGENPLAPPPVIVLLDQSGRVVYTQKLDYLRGEAEVKPENLASGVYYVRIDYNGLSSAVGKITLSF
jgi:hypothetical protein